MIRIAADMLCGRSGTEKTFSGGNCKMKNRFSRAIGRVLYAVASHLPRSYSKIQIGQRRLRAFCAGRILTHCGQEVNIEKGARFASDISLGDCSSIGIRAYIEEGTAIGNFVMMGEDCAIFTRNHAFDKTDVPICVQGMEPLRAVHIGDDVWIGARVILLPGTVIGDGAVIGAGSVVHGEIPPMAVAAGNPCRVIRMRDDRKESL